MNPQLKPPWSLHSKKQTHLHTPLPTPDTSNLAHILRKVGNPWHTLQGMCYPPCERRDGGQQFALEITTKLHRSPAALAWSFGMGEKFLPVTPPILQGVWSLARLWPCLSRSHIQPSRCPGDVGRVGMRNRDVATALEPLVVSPPG